MRSVACWVMREIQSEELILSFLLELAAEEPLAKLAEEMAWLRSERVTPSSGWEDSSALEAAEDWIASWMGVVA